MNILQELKLSKKPWFHCTLCHKILESEDEIVQHFKDEHNYNIKG